MNKSAVRSEKRVRASDKVGHGLYRAVCDPMEVQ